jgi:hypothetical protein
VAKLTYQQVESARLRVQEGSEKDVGPSVLCEALERVIPLLEEIQDNVVELAAGQHWLPAFLVRGLVSSVFDLVLQGLRAWRDTRCNSST